MNKKMREIQAEIAKLSEEVKGYMVEGEGRDLAKAEEHMNKVDALQKEFELEERMEKAAKAGVPAAPAVSVPGASGEPAPVDGVKAFADAARARFKGMNEGTGENGAFKVNDTVEGTIEIEIVGGHKDVVELTYEVDPDDEVSFDEDDFEELFEDEVNDTLEFLEFTDSEGLDEYGRRYV